MVDISYRVVILILFLKIFSGALVAQTITGQVIDPDGKPLPFATIKFAGTPQGVVADLEGRFSFKTPTNSIEVSYTNYTSRKVEILPDVSHYQVMLQLSPIPLAPVVVLKTTGNKLKRILNTAVANRNLNNPDRYESYRCNVYYKMLIDLEVSNAVSTIDSNKTHEPQTLQHQYLMITETHSKRRWQKPARLQEEVTASRMSGFSKPLFAGLVTDVLPFHIYNDFITLNGKDFHNPISRGLYNRFQFKLADEIVRSSDTIWAINFQPKHDPTDLAGTLYISSDAFAITHINARTTDSSSKKIIGIDQQYTKHEGKWFPQQLNYSLQWRVNKEDSAVVTIKGVSVIDSVYFNIGKEFLFDKAHTIKILPNAEQRSDSIWSQIRPVPLDAKETRTYHVVDSVLKKQRIEKLVLYATKLLEGKWPAGKLDININRIYAYNAFENNRIGWGMQTSEQLSNLFGAGAWAAYGTQDKNWKHAFFVEAYADKFKEFIINATYYADIRDPGRLQIHKDIDNNTLRMFLMTRVDKVEGWKLSVQKKLGYLSVELAAGREKIRPQYDYSFKSADAFYQSFLVNEASLNLRWAFGETSAPFLGRYYSSGTKYPVAYSRIIAGKITNANINYAQIVGAFHWKKNLNRFGKERFLFVAGLSLGRQPIPLSKLFAGNGFYGTGTSVYAFGAMQTMSPYQFYSSRFINFYWSHQFNRALFRLPVTRGISLAPTLSPAYNFLYGSLNHAAVHHKVHFSVPVNGFHEAGLVLNNLVRVKMIGLYHVTLNAGYFKNIFRDNSPTPGRLVYGVGLEL